jgi:hypothetical protein
MGVFGWSAVGGLIGEGPEVVFRRWGRWWVVVGCVGLGSFGFGEEKDGGAGKGGCTAEGKNEGKRGKNDLKAGLDGPKTEYVRTYIGTFDRTRAGEWVSCSGMRSNLCKHVRTHACSAVGESRRYGRTSPRQSRTQRSARSNLQKHVRTCSAIFFFFFFFNYIQNKN